MESKAKFLGHPVHPMLIVFPLGLFITSVIFDIVYLINGNGLFPAVSFYVMSAGIIGGLLAAIFGFRDWLAVPSGTRAKSIGAFHGAGNFLIVVLFIISWFMRYNSLAFVPSTLAFFLTLLGVILGTVTAWLGGEMVYRLGLGVDPGANLEASSSLTHQAIDQPRRETFQPSAQSVPVTGANKYREKHIEKGLSPDVNEDLPPRRMSDTDVEHNHPVESDNLD